MTIRACLFDDLPRKNDYKRSVIDDANSLKTNYTRIACPYIKYSATRPFLVSLLFGLLGSSGLYSGV